MDDKNTQKQAFWFAVINYLGVAIGVVSTVVIYPNNKTFLGIIRYVDGIAQLLFPVLLLGSAQSLIYFYPTLTKIGKSQLFKYGIYTILLVSLVVFLLMLLGGCVLDSENYKYAFYALPLALALAFTELFKKQLVNLQRLAVPTFYEKITPKLLVPCIFLLLIAGYFNNTAALLAFVVIFFIILFLIVIYLFKYYKVTSGFNFNVLFSEISKQKYYKYSIYSLIGSFGSFLAFRVDALMIPEFISFEANGVYAIGSTLASALFIPATGIFAIYAPQISSYLKCNEISVLREKYTETSKLLFFIGAILYGCIVLGIDSFFQLLPTYNKLVDSIPVIIVLGANVVFNMGTGFNSEIISYSKYYRFNIIAVLVLMVINIVLNLYVLTQTNLGILGVAFASLIAMGVFNILKLIFIYKKFKITPFTMSYLKVVIISIAVTTVVYLLPESTHAFVNLITKVGLNIVVIVFVVYKLKLVYSLNYWVNKLLNVGK